MPVKPSQSRAAHDAVGKYRNAVERACRVADALLGAAAEAEAAAKVLRPYVKSPLPAIEWEGAPPTAAWLASVDSLIAETKQGLSA